MPLWAAQSTFVHMWSGATIFGDGWLIYRGPSADQAQHAHAAVQIAIAHEGMVSITLAGGAALSGPSLFVAPLVRHQLRSSDHDISLIYLDAQSALARKLLNEVSPATVGLTPISIATMIEGAPANLATTLGRLHADAGAPPADPRLTLALAVLANDMGSGAIARAAKKGGLSTQRLRALAAEQLHLPLSQWLLWRKLERASLAIAAGEGLAQAAISGGFADHAHMSRIMRRMFGVTPSEALAPLRTRTVHE